MVNGKTDKNTKINKRKLGAKYEEEAVRALEKKGYRVIEKNFYCRVGEIDIIAEHEGYLVFIEVKYRKNSRLGTPLEAVTPTKQKTISKVARFYLIRKYKTMDIACRFDVVGMLDDEIKIVKNAFDYKV